jgi:hypothetical protein
MSEMRNVYKVLVLKRNGKTQLLRPKRLWWMVDGSEQNLRGSDSLKSGKFLAKLGEYQLLNKDHASQN